MPETETAMQPLVHVKPGSGETVGVMGEGLCVLLSTRVTNDQLLLVEIDSAPGGGPPALHTHPPFEAFYIIEGTVEFSQLGPDGPETFLAGPGSAVYVPGGAPHNYKTAGNSNARMLGIFSSAAMEQFFHEMAAASHDDRGAPVVPPDFSKLLAVMAKYDVAFVGGPSNQG